MQRLWLCKSCLCTVYEGHDWCGSRSQCVFDLLCSLSRPRIKDQVTNRSPEILRCPNTNGKLGSCRTDTTWQHLPGHATHLTPYFRNATVGYSRFNGSILSQTFTGPSVPAPLSSIELFRAASTFFEDSPAVSLLSGATGTPSATDWIYTNLFIAEVFLARGVTGILNRGGTPMLHAMLTQMLVICQNGVPERLLAGLDGLADLFDGGHGGDGSEFSGLINDLIGNLTGANRPQEIRQPPATTPTSSTVDAARVSFEVVLRPSTLYTYIAFASVALLFCLIALLFKTFTVLGQKCPDIGRWAYLDWLATTLSDDRTHTQHSNAENRAKLEEQGCSGRRGGEVLSRWRIHRNVNTEPVTTLSSPDDGSLSSD